MKSFTSRFAIPAAMTLALAPAAMAQTAQGSITGTITDKTGAVVPGVALTATNDATAAKFTASSNDSGIYTFPVLPVGTYTVSLSKDGFQSLTQKSVPVTVGARLTLDMPLAVASSGESVSVTAEAPIVETTRSSEASYVGEKQIENLPTNGRNFIDFALLTPGVNRDVRGGDISFAGQRGTLNSLTIDGTDNNNTFFGQTLGRTGSGRAPYQFSEDSVQEFQVNTNGYSAEFGRAGGAVINVVTKSGSNAFHGSGFEFFRDRGLNANDPIYSLQRANALNNGRPAPIKPGYHFNQFGGTLGGPIKRNKAFFFFDYDGQRNNTGNPILVNLPAANPADPFQTAAVNYLGQRLGNYNRTFNQDVYLGKVDVNLNNSNQVSVRYNAQRFTGQGQENSGNFSAFEHTGASNVASDSLSGTLSSTLTSSLINVAKVSWQRDHEPGLANSILPEAAVNVNGTFFSVGRNSFSPRETTLHRQEYGDTLTWVRGNHAFKFGADVLHDGILNFFPGNFSGVYSFASLTDFGRSLLGAPVTATGNSFTQNFAGPGTTGGTTHPDLLQIAGFVQDDYRVTSNLTLNLGVRYDVEKPKDASVVNPAAQAFGINTAKIPTDYNNFQPRVGFAWSPFRGEHATVIRGGYGIFYGNTPSIMYGTALSNNGVNVVSESFNASAATPLPTSDYATTLCGAATANPNCAPPAGTLATPNIFTFAPDYVQGYTEQYNLGVEREVAKDMSVSVSYLGVQGHHLQRTNDINLPAASGVRTFTLPDGSTTALPAYVVGGPLVRPLAGFGRVEQFESNANSNYNGVVFAVNKRFNTAFQLSANYTYSHVIDDNPDATAVVIGADDAKEAMYPTALTTERGTGNNDVTHRFIASGLWNLDAYTGGIQNGFAKRVVGGWQLSGIFNAQTGQ
ncbi:MAG TPA: carboxypeptidase regulatory-like domain-containing protein, partial [Terriglobales bacterium]